MAFSGGVKLGDLDDFISLSQECVKPLIEATDGGNMSAKLSNVSEAKALPVAEAAVPLVQRPNLIKSKQSGTDPKAQIGQVTLSDCLACSGCVTSAETVLLQEQSGEEFLKRAASSPLTVVSISAEARTSLASRCGESPLLAMRRAAEGLRRLGANYVLDCSAAEAIALLEGKAEFIKRFKSAQMPGGGGSSSSRPGREKSSQGGGANLSSALPLLTSHCPGWTLYAEKVVDPVVLPHLSPLRPPQHVQGRLVKTCLLEAHNRRRFHRWWRARSPLLAAERSFLPPSLLEASATEAPGPEPLTAGDVYHVIVQPCFDRKIEAARPSFEVPGASGVREVDTVLTASELLELLQQKSCGACSQAGDCRDACQEQSEIGLARLPPCPLDSEVLTDLLLQRLTRAERPAPLICAVAGNAGSGGFAELVFREAAKELFGISVSSAPLKFQTKQNEDMREVTLQDPATKKTVLRFTSAYGFRNIQNVIRRISKAGDTSATCGHFVEIMACPGGCLNGGGQIQEGKVRGNEADGTGQAARRLRLERLEKVLTCGEGTVEVAPAKHPLVLPLYRYIVSSSSEAARSLLKDAPLDSLIGSESARSWLAAEWRSLKIDSEGKDVVSTSVLKW